VKHPKNLSESIRQRLLNLARERQEEFQFVLMHFVLERVLYRISMSTLTNEFVLKGAMLLEAALDERHRATKDLDLLGFGTSTPESVCESFRTILATEVQNDGLDFPLDEITAERIRDDDEYSGVRVYVIARLGTARIKVHVDVGFGDAVTPAPLELHYPTMLDLPAPVVRSYPIETVVAEKFQIICEFGMLNSRMKDYFDLWIISSRFDLSRATLAEAIHATFTRRGTSSPTSSPIGLTAEFSTDTAKQRQWAAFLKKGRLDGDSPTLTAVVEALDRFLMPVAREAATRS
jgi:predicted nucleotidyltransferase component of viral defense system